MVIFAVGAAAVLSYTLRVAHTHVPKGAEPAIKLSETNHGRTTLHMIRTDGLMVSMGANADVSNAYVFPLGPLVTVPGPVTHLPTKMHASADGAFSVPPGKTHYLWGTASTYFILHGFRDFAGAGSVVTIRYCEWLSNGGIRPVQKCSNPVTVYLE